jgi:hypothetical protein
MECYQLIATDSWIWSPFSWFISTYGSVPAGEWSVGGMRFALFSVA